MGYGLARDYGDLGSLAVIWAYNCLFERRGRKMNTVPVACSLSSEELRQRRDGVLAKLAQAIQSTQERKEGYLYQFAPTEEILELLFHTVNLERQCCPFLRFQVTLEPGGGPIWLELTGPEGTQDFISSLFDFST